MRLPRFRRRRPPPDVADTLSTGGRARQLAWLVGAVWAAALPHMPHVTPWVGALLLMASVWRIGAARRGWRLPGAIMRACLTLAGFAGVMATYQRISGIDAGSALLLVMVSLKLLETCTRRDRAIVVYISLFVLFAGFLRDQPIWSIAWLAVALPVTLAALLQSGRSHELVPARQCLSLSARLLAQAAPLGIVLFLLFPRIPGPFWAMPTGAGAGLSGLGDEMTPGDITALGLSDEVAFRVRFREVPPAPQSLYWRGPVLSRWDGRSWRAERGGHRARLAESVIREGRAYEYELIMEPHERRWLPALEATGAWDAERAWLASNWQLVRFEPLRQRLAFNATAWLTGTLPGFSTSAADRALSVLPEGTNPRAMNLASTLRAEVPDDRAYLDALLRLFAGNGFTYTLNPPPLGAHTVDRFLFETRQGFCGHYASAFAVLARAAGLPARVVTGYQGAEFNPLGDYWIVRQSNAHAWTEVLVEGQWLRYDPTAVVAPARIDNGPAPLPGSGAIGRLFTGSALLTRIGLGWDALNTAWDRWVLSYGPDTQTALLFAAGFRRPNLRHLLILMSVAAAAAIGITVWLAQRGQSRRPPLALRSWRLLCRRLARAARPRRPGEGPADYAQAVAELRPDLAQETGELARMYLCLRYEPSPGSELAARFARRVRGFRPAARARATAA